MTMEQQQSEAEYRDEFGLVAPIPASHGQRRAPDEGFYTGPEVGERLPAFTLRSSEGRLVDFHADRAGRKAAVVFHRSAVWCPLCMPTRCAEPHAGGVRAGAARASWPSVRATMLSGATPCCRFGAAFAAAQSRCSCPRVIRAGAGRHRGAESARALPHGATRSAGGCHATHGVTQQRGDGD